MTCANLAYDWVIQSGKTIQETREEYDGACIDFAGDLLDAINQGRMVHFDTPSHPRWKYHAAVEIDGLIHDLWTDAPMPTAEFLQHLGGGVVSYPLEEPA